MKSNHLRASALILGFSMILGGCSTTGTPSQTTVSEAKPATQNQTQLHAASNFGSNDLIYFVLTDRFKDGTQMNNQYADVDKSQPQAYHGGDFVGLTQSLDYIQSLGTTAIWVTPILKNQPRGYHGYWAIDFEQIDPHLGTEAEFKTFVDEAHKRGIKVLLDYVVNHTGEETPWLKDSTKKDWFHKQQNISNWSDLKEVENNWLFGLPDLNTENKAVADYLTNNALDWIRKTGIDGMRLDTVRHVPRPFWNDFCKAIKTEFPDFYFLGEVWNDNTRYMQLYNDAGIDGLTNYSIYKGITGTFSRTGSSASMISALEKEKFFKYPNQNGIFIDNHDNPRYLTVNGKAATKQALAFMMTYPAIPMIYYGTEIGMEGKGDPDNRRDMAWDKIQGNPMLAYYQQLLQLRQKNPEITNGQIQAYKTSKNLLVYEIRKDQSAILVIMNLRSTPLSESLALPSELQFKGKPELLLNEGDGNADLAKSSLEVQLSPNQIMVYRVQH